MAPLKTLLVVSSVYRWMFAQPFCSSAPTTRQLWECPTPATYERAWNCKLPNYPKHHPPQTGSSNHSVFTQDCHTSHAFLKHEFEWKDTTSKEVLYVCKVCNLQDYGYARERVGNSWGMLVMFHFVPGWCVHRVFQLQSWVRYLWHSHCQAWWCRFLVLRRQKQVELYEFKASLVYLVNSRPLRATL